MDGSCVREEGVMIISPASKEDVLIDLHLKHICIIALRQDISGLHWLCQVLLWILLIDGIVHVLHFECEYIICFVNPSLIRRVQMTKILQSCSPCCRNEEAGNDE